MTKKDVKELGWYVEHANEIIKEYGPLRIMQDKLDKMSRLEWELPSGMNLQWMRNVKTTAPYDAIRAGVRVLSGLDEHIKIEPASVLKAVGGISPESEEARHVANEWERALKWQMDLAVRRRSILRQDVPRSAIKYDEVVGQVIHLPTQIRAIENMQGSASRQKAALARGQFAIIPRNPRNVYVRYSDYMAESVLYIKIMSPQRIMREWNNEKLGKLIEDKEADKKWIFFDYVDYDSRAVFCYPGEDPTKIGLDEKSKGSGKFIELMMEDWPYDFLPWSAVVGGSQLESAPHFSRFPMLYGVYKAEQWITANILGSLQVSEAIAEAARPDLVRSGPDPESIELQYDTVGGAFDVPPAHEIKVLEQKPLDPALREAYDRFVADMARATIPSVLITAEAAPEETFSGFNLRIQQAVGALLPWKLLSERWFAETYRIMLYWAKASNTPIEGFGDNGQVYRINPKDIDRERLYLDVELEPDVPIDKQQRMLTAIQASQQLKMPTRQILEMLGVTDPERMVDQWMMEQLEFAYLQGQTERIATEAAGILEQQAQQMAEEVIAAQAAEGAQAPREPGVAEGIPAAEGDIFDPAAGGLPAQSSAPGATREGQTGQDRLGNAVLG